MPHDHGTGPAGTSPFEEFLKLQTAFQQNLSQATMNYLRQLQGLVGPVTPGTVVQPVDGLGLALTVTPGGQAKATLTAENRQRVHTLVTPMPTPLVSETGTTWFAQSDIQPPTALLASDETARFAVTLTAPATLPPGIYRGAVLIYGCADGVVPIEVAVGKPGADRPPAAARRSPAGKGA